VISQQNRTALMRTQLEERVRTEVVDRVVGVYKQLDGGAVGYLRAENKIADAVILSSDGWVVMYHSNGVLNYKKWKALASDGAVYDFEKALFDDRTGLAFLKISLQQATDRERTGGQFKVVSLSDSINALDEIYVYDNASWQYSWVNAAMVGAFDVPHDDSGPSLAYTLRYNFSPGAIAVNGQGRLMMNKKEKDILLINKMLDERIQEGLQCGYSYKEVLDETESLYNLTDEDMVAYGFENLINDAKEDDT
jgi:hypothetical protein